ncbi:MAG: hypothetical protein C0169_01635 [Thermodesulfobacterium geofontis]|uniref:PAS domain-containing protein n=1 Tax=Thermodesulfobacterium geofontis TaxID=1295609 RepID=A0A2N7QFZ5_9BACT|nr:MAG: hypothetical protein C0169_01635 [Thermodesulfobacterium geofontis]
MDLILILSIFLNLILGLALGFLIKKFISQKKLLKETEQERIFWEEAFYQLEFPVFIINKKREIFWQNKAFLNKFGYLKGGKIDLVLRKIKNYPWEIKRFSTPKEREIQILIDKFEEELFKKKLYFGAFLSFA